jgi:hypothetical protein
LKIDPAVTRSDPDMYTSLPAAPRLDASPHMELAVK